MNTQEYSKNLLELVDDLLGRKNDWEMNTITYNQIEAYATIDTVVGPLTLTVGFDGTKVFPVILLKKDGELSEEMETDLFVQINMVNYLYGNTIVAFLVPDDSDDTVVALRGVTFITFQDDSDLTNYSFKRRDPIVLSPAGGIVDFIQNINNGLGTDNLCSLIQMFN